MKKVFPLLLVLSLALNAWQLTKRSTKSGNISGDPKASGSDNSFEQGSLSGRRTPIKGLTTRSSEPTSYTSLDEVLAIGDPLTRYEALIAFIRNLDPNEIEGYLGRIRSGKGKMDSETNMLRRLLYARWTQEDPDGALANLSSAGGKQAYEDAGTVIGTLASMDPARAAAWLADPENALLRQPWMSAILSRTVAEQWARQDPDAALAWASTLEAEQRSGAYAGIINNIMASDPQRAAELAMSLDEYDRPKLLGQIAESWAARDPAEAVAWANSLSEGEREGSLQEALGSWAASDPSKAAAYVDQMPEQERAGVVGEIARNWAQQEPAEAAEWLGNQPESEGKAGAMGQVMWNWTTSDPEAAANWLGEQPAGPSYDNGVTGLAKAATHAYDDPSTAVTWASTIENPDLRDRMTTHTLGVWRRQDEQAAQAWAAENEVELPEAQRRGK
ncbi:MAG: hypothetical protein CMN06_03625 [Roseibacillus sp.]|nr:hypothetical protein [Roseibacillus sp.]